MFSGTCVCATVREIDVLTSSCNDSTGTEHVSLCWSREVLRRQTLIAIMHVNFDSLEEA